MGWITWLVAIYMFVGVIYFMFEFYLNNEYVDTALYKAILWPKHFLLLAFKVDD